MDDFSNWVVWWALVAALPIYVVVAFVVADPSKPEAAPGLVAGLAAGALVLGGITVLVRRRFLSGPIQSGELDLRTPAGRQTAYQRFVLCLVLGETIGIFGLVLSFLSGRPAYVVVFVLAALALQYGSRPGSPALQPPLGAGTTGRRPPPIG